LTGQVLDGRRRWLACSIAQIKPATREVKPSDPVAYVLSLNLHRRHLTPSQLSMVAARARELYDQQAKERMKDGGKKGGQCKGKENLPYPSAEQQARDAAGKAVGVSGRSVDSTTSRPRNGSGKLARRTEEERFRKIYRKLITLTPATLPARPLGCQAVPSISRRSDPEAIDLQPGFTAGHSGPGIGFQRLQADCRQARRAGDPS